MKGVIAAGLVTAALLPSAPDMDTLSDAADTAKESVRSHTAAKPAEPQGRSHSSTRTEKAPAASPGSALPAMGKLIICAVGADTFVAAARRTALGGNLTFGVREGQCRTEAVPGGRYRVRSQGSDAPACTGAVAWAVCELGRVAYRYVQVSSGVRGGFAKFVRRDVDVNVAGGGTTTVSFVFGQREH